MLNQVGWCATLCLKESGLVRERCARRCGRCGRCAEMRESVPTPRACPSVIQERERERKRDHEGLIDSRRENMYARIDAFVSYVYCLSPHFLPARLKGQPCCCQQQQVLQASADRSVRWLLPVRTVRRVGETGAQQVKGKSSRAGCLRHCSGHCRYTIAIHCVFAV